MEINSIEQFFIGDIRNINIDWDFVNSIPEFNILNTTEQNAIYHEEGNVMNHTKMVCDEMKHFMIGDDDTGSIAYMMLSALFHDIGKGVTTKLEEDGLYHSKNHASAGEKITRKLLWNIDFNIREKVCALVANHMKPLYVKEKENADACVIELSLLCSLNDLAMLKLCDCLGAVNKDTTWNDSLNAFILTAKKLNCYYQPYNFTDDDKKFRFFNQSYDETIPTKKDFKVIIMCGIPGAGKSTYIAQNFEGMPVICRDEIRKEIGLKGEKTVGNKAEEKKVTEISNQRIKEYCESNTSFIMDATFLKRAYRQEIVEMVSPYRPIIEIVYIEAPTIEDNLKRRNEQIYESVIRKMQRHFEFPRTTECHTLTLIKQ